MAKTKNANYLFVSVSQTSSFSSLSSSFPSPSSLSYRFAGIGDDSLQRLLHESFTFRIQSGSCFIQQQDFGVDEQRACDGDALLLTAGQFHSAFADARSEEETVREIAV